MYQWRKPLILWLVNLVCLFEKLPSVGYKFYSFFFSNCFSIYHFPFPIPNICFRICLFEKLPSVGYKFYSFSFSNCFSIYHFPFPIPNICFRICLFEKLPTVGYKFYSFSFSNFHYYSYLPSASTTNSTSNLPLGGGLPSVGPW